MADDNVGGYEIDDELCLPSPRAEAVERHSEPEERWRSQRATDSDRERSEVVVNDSDEEKGETGPASRRMLREDYSPAPLDQGWLVPNLGCGPERGMSDDYPNGFNSEYHPKSGMYIEKYSGRLVHPVGGENSFFFFDYGDKYDRASLTERAWLNLPMPPGCPELKGKTVEERANSLSHYNAAYNILTNDYAGLNMERCKQCEEDDDCFPCVSKYIKGRAGVCAGCRAKNIYKCSVKGALEEPGCFIPGVSADPEPARPEKIVGHLCSAEGQDRAGESSDASSTEEERCVAAVGLIRR
ncbi:hypothetical protein FFLO_07143 [Filobasidium floriforme]|uniref:Uncharacterized protein n=1 Tax=Filobasidium floriforme TaxID=5210 RepID=A0A8K0NM63_9TREE|nr:hypothetical protein FFLO_07143 [Filobasidium floriforme]